MSHRRRKDLKENRIIVAISLLGLDENGRRRTQNEVSVSLGYPKSTVSECVRDLLDGGYIVESGKSRKEKIYARGPRFCLLESQISDEIRQKLRNLRSVRIDSPPITAPDRSGVPGGSSSGQSHPFEDAWSIHLPGDMLQFAVDREGAIDRVAVAYRDPDTGRERTRWQTIFYGEPYELNGSVNWSTSFVIPEHPGENRFTMRYQKTASGKWFYVVPEFDVLVNSHEAVDADAMRRRFVTKCAPLLNWLQKYAGWRFALDEFGMYDLLTEIDVKSSRAERGNLAQFPLTPPTVPSGSGRFKHLSLTFSESSSMKYMPWFLSHSFSIAFTATGLPDGPQYPVVFATVQQQFFQYWEGVPSGNLYLSGQSP